ncbi:ATP-binding protein [Oscillatoria sp. CS-180]|uniref:AlbA family DNA-binding domain-containing protein n=1 Tax=Oscillatoria sp. CS-180 TaxID=3021720 RepID=UPI00232CCC55|nr:ATP-binding protein [Oscillatoria sp. CS-180]MDB9528731.1 ATP-binding protein [Oscillatoria sp. CS-180]
MKHPWQWDITDLDNLIGQPESLRLEFKDARLLDLNQKGNSINKVVTELSKEVSAFANTEGGTLIIGIEEDKDSKPRVALRISSVDISFWNPEKLQQIISSNISPPLPGIRVKLVYLDVERSSCVYVIYIPTGTTAYQAKDHIYYGRSEYESKALPDHEIRMRMFRGKVPNATLIIKKANRENKPIYLGQERRFLEDGEILGEGYKPILESQYSLQVFLKNIGETNIQAFKCRIKFVYSELFDECAFGKMLRNNEYSFKEGWQEQEIRPALGMLSGKTDIERPKMKVNIFPDDTFFICRCSFGLEKAQRLLEDDLLLKWTLYLEDRTPCQGEIEIREDIFTNGKNSQE